MNIQRTSNQNFCGGFRLRNVSDEVKTKIPELINKRGKQVFNNFENTNDVFVVVRDKYDRIVAKFIKDNGISLEYYPQISTKSGLDTECPELLSELLKKNKFAPITSTTKFKKHISNVNRTKYIEEKSVEYVDKILKSLCIDNKHPIKTKNGVKIVVDNEFERKILISPPSVRNIHYVIVRPNSANKSAQRYAIDSDGNILQSYKTPEGIKKFGERFNELMIKNV